MKVRYAQRLYADHSSLYLRYTIRSGYVHFTRNTPMKQRCARNTLRLIDVPFFHVCVCDLPDEDLFPSDKVDLPQVILARK